MDSHKNKKPIKDNLPKNNYVIKRQKLNEKQKVINTHQNKEKNKLLRRKEKPILLYMIIKRKKIIKKILI